MDQNLKVLWQDIQKYVKLTLNLQTENLQIKCFLPLSWLAIHIFLFSCCAHAQIIKCNSTYDYCLAVPSYRRSSQVASSPPHCSIT